LVDLGDEKPTLFVRKASGLVREVSTLRAGFFNLCAVSGDAQILGNSYFALFFPTILLFGFLPIYTFTVIWIGLLLVIYALIFVFLTSAMPRTGGEYIFTSRIIHPYLGWIESWTLLWSALALIGYLIWGAVQTIHIICVGNALAYPGSIWVGVAEWLSTPAAFTIVGSIIIIWVAIITLRPTKTFHKTITIGAIIGLIFTGIFLLLSLTLNPTSFAQALFARTGLTPEAIIGQAETDFGFDPLGGLTFASYGGLIVWAVSLYIGFVWSAYIAGELKGKVERNVLYSTMFGLFGGMILWALVPLPFMFGSGYTLGNAWNWMYWASPNTAPLGIPLWIPLILTIARPDLAPLITIAGIFGGVIFILLAPPCWTILVSRIQFAWSMDRMTPEWLSKVSPRTHTPVRITVITVIGGWAFLLYSIYGVSPILTLWFMAIVSMLTWIMPGLNAILLPRRRPDIYELVPPRWKRKIAGIRLMTLLGAVASVVMILVYALTVLWPMAIGFVGLTPTEAAQYIQASGLSLCVVVVVVGTIWYIVARWWNKKRGIDIGAVYKAIPPE
jgi:amino acid transporter